jgi:uncharacterized membrane protein
MTVIHKRIELDVPVRTAYDQWTQFEEFPRFLEGVKEVRQLDDKRVFWSAVILGKEVEWEAEIIQQIPDQRITWHSISGAVNGGSIAFTPLEEGRSAIEVHMEFQPEGATEALGSAFGIVSARIDGDLERFKEFIESRHQATGQWRGEIHGPEVVVPLQPDEPRRGTS